MSNDENYIKGKPIFSKYILLLALYVSQGVSAGFVVVSLPVLLRLRGESIEIIGWAGLLSWPWALKFLWGPLIDRYNCSKYGARRTWILPLQILVAGFLFILSVTGNKESLLPLLIIIVLMNLATSMLDVATDAYATDILSSKERGWGNSIQIGGFYIGSLIGSGFFLVLQESIGTQTAFSLLGILVLIPLYFLKSNQETPKSFTGINSKASFVNFFRRPYARYVIVLIILLDFGENFGVSMLSPFFVDKGISSKDIGILLGTVGMISGLIGAIMAGFLLKRMSPYKSLVIFALFQTCGMIGYIIIDKVNTSLFMISAGIIGIQYFCANMFNVALYACFMGWTYPNQTATDFSIMACAHNAIFLIATPLAGYSVKILGYSGHFTLACVISILCIVIANQIISRNNLLMNNT